jgi:hypothetical protein
MKITYDDQYLITVAEDASIMLWKIQDKEGRGLKRDKEVGWAEEILITKSDLEEKVGADSRVPSGIINPRVYYRSKLRFFFVPIHKDLS